MAVKAQQFETRQYMQQQTYEIFRYSDPYLKEVTLHHHDFYEVYFFLSGSVRYNIESRSYHLMPGDVLLISPMELHQPVFTGEQHSYERIVLWINKQYLENLAVPGADFGECFNSRAPGYTNLLRLDGDARYQLSYLLDLLLMELEAEDDFRDVCALSYLVQVLILLNRQARRHWGSREEGTLVQPSVAYQMLNYINEHYSEDLPLDHLANRFFTSKYHLSREFQRLTGTSVHRYIIQKRLAMAKQMMSQGIPAAEVYQHCGFGDYSNFYRAFKNEYQMTPKEYLAQQRESPSYSGLLTRRVQNLMEK